MKKRNIIQLSIISCLLIGTGLMASGITKIQNFSNYPLNKDVTSQSRGGSLPDSEAIKDGVGTIILKSVTPTTKKYNNSSYNDILLKYKNKMVDNNKTLDQLMTDNIINVPTDTLDDLNDNDLVVDPNKNFNNGFYLKFLQSYPNKESGQNIIAITELKLYNNNNLISYNRSDIDDPIHYIDDVSNLYWNQNDCWSTDNLNDNNFNYTNNLSGRYNATILWLQNDNTTSIPDPNSWAKFKINKQNINHIKIWLGSYEKRNAKILEILDSNQNIIKTINLDNWTSPHELDISF